LNLARSLELRNNHGIQVTSPFHERQFMALINCYECQKTISDKAASCPHCGAPQDKFVNSPPLPLPPDNHASSAVNAADSGIVGMAAPSDETTLLLRIFVVGIIVSAGLIYAAANSYSTSHPAREIKKAEVVAPSGTARAGANLMAEKSSDASTPTSRGVTGNPAHDRLSNLTKAEQAALLGKAVPCTGTDAFFMGMGPEREAFWSFRCTDGRSYAVSLAPKVAGSKVVECSALAAVGAGPCFKKFSDQ
jgi:hypothetical protein